MLTCNISRDLINSSLLWFLLGLISDFLYYVVLTLVRVLPSRQFAISYNHLLRFQSDIDRMLTSHVRYMPSVRDISSSFHHTLLSVFLSVSLSLTLSIVYVYLLPHIDQYTCIIYTFLFSFSSFPFSIYLSYLCLSLCLYFSLSLYIYIYISIYMSLSPYYTYIALL